jgi:hypothetical protein
MSQRSLIIIGIASKATNDRDKQNVADHIIVNSNEIIRNIFVLHSIVLINSFRSRFMLVKNDDKPPMIVYHRHYEWDRILIGSYE